MTFKKFLSISIPLSISIFIFSFLVYLFPITNSYANNNMEILSLISAISLLYSIFGTIFWKFVKQT